MWSGIFVILISLGTVFGESRNPRVTTEFGIHKGVWTESLRGHRIASYLGIPYAKPPIGELRFKKPSPWTRQWPKVRDFTNFASPCLEFGGAKIGSEDCLYLNIFTPQVNQETRGENDTNFAVLVFLIDSLYGYNENYLYDPFYLLEQDIVLVTVNFRYGYFGFFTTGDAAAPGNYGLKDVLEALAWLQKNIKSFGGDPENVTLMGQGTGAGIAHILALSEKSEGLFHKYVTQSGAAQAVLSFRPLEDVKNYSLQSAISVNCNQTTSQEIVKCMRNIPDAVRIDINTFPIVTPWESYGPTAEPESEEAVITEDPRTLMKNGKMRDIPWLTGVVADEGLLITRGLAENYTMCNGLAENFSEIVFGLANYRQRIVDQSSYIQELTSFYFNGNVTVDCADGFAEMAGDMLINWPVYESLILQAKSMKSDIYFYDFAYNGTFTITFGVDESKRYGVCHTDELNYLFPVLNTVFEDLQLENTADDITMINVMTEMWANFAKTGVPSARWSPEWESYQKGQGYMEFGPRAKLSMQNDSLPERMIFWSDLTEKLFLKESGKPEDDASRGVAISAFVNVKDVHIFKYLFSLPVLLLIGGSVAR